MTDPLEPDDVELLKRYDAELEQLESLPPAAIELPANQAKVQEVRSLLASGIPPAEIARMLKSPSNSEFPIVKSCGHL